MFDSPNGLIPRWPAPAGVHALCSTRLGGVSLAPYQSLNLADHVGDEALHVQANRRIFRRAMAAHPVYLRQVHGCAVLRLERESADAGVADAAFTATPGVACTVLVADCLPILLTDTQGAWVAALHAGWRGLAGTAGVGVIEQSVAQLLAQASGAGADLMAWLGPCIGPQAFAVGAEVRSAFCCHDALAASLFIPGASGKWYADLAGLARRRLQTLGIRRIFGNDASAPWCTVQNTGRFFSHRRDHVSGRFAVAIWRDG